MEATLREMGVTFSVRRQRAWAPKPWHCDILPQIFEPAEWRTLARGFDQRLRAFECFLQDVYGQRRILHSGTIPIAPVLGSPYFEGVAAELRPTRGAFLHVTGLCISRLADGTLGIRHHYFSNASGISYMMQNRRALARVNPGLFAESPLLQIADTPTSILEELRDIPVQSEDEPTVVLLTPGTGSPAYSEHTLLARRMGIPLVQGDDLLVLNDRLFLKTVNGLQRVEVVYSRIADPWLDPLVFRRDSLLGVPGLVHCIRRGTVALVNSIGSQLADDRALLPFASKLIRYYLGETPILPTVETRWLGDPDQQMIVLDNLENFRIRPLYGEKVLGPHRAGKLTKHETANIRRAILSDPLRFVAQPAAEGALARCYHDGKPVDRIQDHIIFALRRVDGYEIFPGALTRIASAGSTMTASELGGGSKDSWVLADSEHPEPVRYRPRRAREHTQPTQLITSRVAESFYWVGRYLERAYSLAYMIGVVESLETEELNAAERRLYRPVWNSLLPPLEAGQKSRRNIATAHGRYRLMLDPGQHGSVTRILGRAFANAESIQDTISPEAWLAFDSLRTRWTRTRFREGLPDAEYMKIARRLADATVSMIPQFLGTAQITMLADEGLRFCELGQQIERAIVTANAVLSLSGSLTAEVEGKFVRRHESEIELSAFLRLLGTRDAYRRVYQMRASHAEVLDLLWKHPDSPRSIGRSLSRCASLLRHSLSSGLSDPGGAIPALEALQEQIQRIDWHAFFQDGTKPPENMLPELLLKKGSRGSALKKLLEGLLARILEMHYKIADGFLNHQAFINQARNSLLPGMTSVE